MPALTILLRCRRAVLRVPLRTFVFRAILRYMPRPTATLLLLLRRVLAYLRPLLPLLVQLRCPPALQLCRTAHTSCPSLLWLVSGQIWTRGRARPHCGGRVTGQTHVASGNSVLEVHQTLSSRKQPPLAKHIHQPHTAELARRHPAGLLLLRTVQIGSHARNATHLRGCRQRTLPARRPVMG